METPNRFNDPNEKKIKSNEGRESKSHEEGIFAHYLHFLLNKFKNLDTEIPVYEDIIAINEFEKYDARKTKRCSICGHTFKCHDQLTYLCHNCDTNNPMNEYYKKGKKYQYAIYE